MKITFIALILLAAAIPLRAQETQDTFELREVVVSATRLPLERSAVSASVSVLHTSELRRQGIRNVADALRQVTGATLVQGGSYGAPTSLFMRGGESDYVQVLIDGVQVNSPGEIFDFGNLTLENIARIEVVRGPSSVLYGSDAVTGIVHLFTHDGSGRTHVDVAANGGTHQTGSVNAELRNEVYGLGVSHFRTDGTYAYNNGHSNTGVTGRLLLSPDRTSSIRLSGRYNTSEFHYPTNGSGELVDANQYHVADAVTLGLDAAKRLGARFELRTQLAFNRNSDRYDDRPDDAADTTGFFAFYSNERFQRESADLRLNVAAARSSIVTIGAEYERQKQRGWNLSESSFGPFESRARDERSNRAAYLQLVTVVRAADVQAGARIEDNERFGRFATYRGGVSIPVTNAFRLRASAGTGFKEPRFYEQFATGFVKGNPDLEPETSRSLEGGAEFTLAGTRLGGTWFTQSFRNLIQYIGAPATASDPNYMNLAGARARGVEFEAARTLRRLSLRAALTLLDTKVTDDGTGDDPLFVAGTRLIRRPEHTAALTASYASRGFAASATANYVGERHDLDFRSFPAERVTLGAYTRVDFAAEAPVRENVRATLKLENVLGADYEEVFNFPARGRLIFVGLRYSR